MRLPLLTLGALLLAACSKSDPPKPEPPGAMRGTPPPPADSASKPGACKGGGGEVKDPVSAPFFPRTVGAYCVNPEGETQAYGDKAPAPLKGICTQLFDGGCEAYIERQLKRTVSFDYVDGGGSGATINVVLSQFASAEHAYAMYTLRVLGGEDPTRADMPKKAELGAPAAQGTGTLYAAKGAYLLELSYVNSDESGDATKLKASAERALPPVARAIVDKLPGAPLPSAVALLPSEHMIPLGVTYALGKALGVEGTGNGAVGAYRDGERRYRVLVLSKDDPEQAKDVLKSFSKVKGAQEEKNLAEGATRLMLQEAPDEPKAEWVVARKGKLVVGVGDDPFALKGNEASKVALPKEEKIKRLKAILDASK